MSLEVCVAVHVYWVSVIAFCVDVHVHMRVHVHVVYLVNLTVAVRWEAWYSERCLRKFRPTQRPEASGRDEPVSAGPTIPSASSPADPVALTGQPCEMCGFDCDGTPSVTSTDVAVTSDMSSLFHTRNRKDLRTFLEGRSRLPCTGAHAECRGQLLRMFEGALKEK